jgi:hypothetical protein
MRPRTADGVVALGELSGWWQTDGCGRRGICIRVFRVGLVWPLAGECGLSLASAKGLIELPGQLGDLSFGLCNTLEELPTAATGVRV